jgi:hypothetical protein
MVPRPDIHLHKIDPRHEFTFRHFEELHERYGGPVFVFDLIRQHEKRARETTLGKGLAEALEALQMRLRREGHPLELRYVPFDFKKESKRKGGDVLQSIEKIAAHLTEEIGFFSTVPPPQLGAAGAGMPSRLLPLPLPESPAEKEALARLTLRPGDLLPELGAYDGLDAPSAAYARAAVARREREASGAPSVNVNVSADVSAEGLSGRRARGTGLGAHGRRMR